MPGIEEHQSGQSTKLLFIGNSGAGKSGALASLASAGYNLRILDVDNGLDVLKNLLTDPTSMYKKIDPTCAKHVEYITVTDKMKTVGGKLQPSAATVWTRSMGLLNDWKEQKADGTFYNQHGHISTWGPQDVIVIDSLTMLSNAALAFILSLNGRLGQHPQLQDWGAGQSLIEGLLQMLYDDAIKCNVIINCHITFIGEENGPQMGFPNTLGKALPPKVGRYFNTILMAKATGQGTNVKQKILTRTSGVVELKNTAPMKVLAEYPLETGLADYFKAVRAQ